MQIICLLLVIFFKCLPHGIFHNLLNWKKFAKVEYLLKKYESLFKENLFLCSGMPR